MRWYARYERFMTEHHAREDEQLFPVLSTADPDCLDLVAEMADEHAQLEDAFAQVGRALDALRRRNKPYDQRLALASAQKFRDVLERHLDHEEFEVLPRFTATVAADVRSARSRGGAAHAPPQRALRPGARARGLTRDHALDSFGVSGHDDVLDVVQV